MMFVHPSVCLSGTGVHCDYTVNFSADLSLRLDMDVQIRCDISRTVSLKTEVKLLLSANRKSHVPRRWHNNG